MKDPSSKIQIFVEDGHANILANPAIGAAASCDTYIVSCWKKAMAEQIENHICGRQLFQSLIKYSLFPILEVSLRGIFNIKTSVPVCTRSSKAWNQAAQWPSPAGIVELCSRGRSHALHAPATTPSPAPPTAAGASSHPNNLRNLHVDAATRWF